MVLALLLQMASAASGRACGFAPDVVRSTGVSGLQIGMTVAQIRARCVVKADRRDYDDEDSPIRMLDIGSGSGGLTVRLDRGRADNIWTANKALRTAGGLGVDTPLVALLRQFPDLQGGQSEGGPLYVYSDRLCGISFQLGYKVSGRQYMRLGDNWRRSDLEQLPRSVRVVGVLITGCEAH